LCSRYSSSQYHGNKGKRDVRDRAAMRAWKLLVALLAFVAAPSCSLHAAQAEHGILVRVANIYLSPDSSSAKLGEVERGREVAIFEKSRDWLHVLASVTAERDITGWIFGKGVVTTSTPN